MSSKTAEFIFLYPKTGLDVGGAVAPPFSSMYASVLLHEADYRIKIIDQRKEQNWRRILSVELKKEPTFVGITSMTGPQVKFAIEMASYVRKESSVPIVWGGPHVSTLPKQTVESEYCDIAVVNEGEEAVLEIGKALEDNKPLDDINGIYYKQNGKILSTPPRSLIDVNTLPDTPWELVDVEKYIFRFFYIKNKLNRVMDIGETSRGCPFKCKYCSNSQIKKRIWRPMTAQKTLAKIVNDVREFELDGIWIRDDNFFVDLKRVKEICQGFIDSKLNIGWYTAGTRVNDINRMDDDLLSLIKKSGCSTFKIGAESGCNRILKYIDKVQTREDIFRANEKVAKSNIASIYTFMIGFPTETREEMLETIETMKQVQKDNKDAMIDAMNMFTPHKGTPLYDEALKLGLKEPESLVGWQDWNFRGKNQAEWFTYSERSFIENACDISIYCENVRRFFDSMKNPIMRITLRFLMYIPEKYFRLKWKYNLFGSDPILVLMRNIRKVWLKEF